MFPFLCIHLWSYLIACLYCDMPFTHISLLISVLDLSSVSCAQFYTVFGSANHPVNNFFQVRNEEWMTFVCMMDVPKSVEFTPSAGWRRRLPRLFKSTWVSWIMWISVSAKPRLGCERTTWLRYYSPPISFLPILFGVNVLFLLLHYKTAKLQAESEMLVLKSGFRWSICYGFQKHLSNFLTHERNDLFSV